MYFLISFFGPSKRRDRKNYLIDTEKPISILKDTHRDRLRDRPYDAEAPFNAKAEKVLLLRRHIARRKMNVFSRSIKPASRNPLPLLRQVFDENHTTGERNNA